ncbi:Hypothetical predicted protein [Podarcis lilfordi]|uniref:Uncharacterized protein n=1 Tax=Podarcis lilfordi TaxID=74358 RepID=A0AA35JNP7_9SAUR|nr:Hypothetical predicted protein [Podarcis lilfordi]
MCYFVGTLQEQSLAMNKQLTTLTSGISSSAECIEDLNEKKAAAEPEQISQELKETKQGKEKAQMESTNQKPTHVDYKQEDPWITWITNLQKMRKLKEEAPGVLGIQELKRKKKYDGGLHSEYEGLVELLQQLSLSFLVGRKSGLTGTELLRDPKTNIKDYQQNQRRGTERDMNAASALNVHV